MEARTCKNCGGAGSVSSGKFEPCQACGGRGHGIDANVRCPACKGSGDSGTEVMELCGQCHGTGLSAADEAAGSSTGAEIDDIGLAGSPDGAEAQPANASTQPAPAIQHPDAAARRVIGSIAFILGIGVALYVYFKLAWSVEEAIGVGITASLASYFALTIVYLLVKVTLKVLQYTLIFAVWLLVVCLVARFLGYGWPTEIYEFMFRLLDNLGLV